MSLRLLRLLWLVAVVVFAVGSARGQQVPNVPGPGLALAFRFTATEANSPPGSCGCFFLYGGAADVALPLVGGLSMDVEMAGSHSGLVPRTERELSTITLLAGPRYRVTLPRQQSVFVQGLFGAARGFDAEFRRGANAIDTATAFGYAVGAGYEVTLMRGLTLRPLQVEYLQTNLPNGSDNRQRNVRLGGGVVVRISAVGLRR